MCNTIIHYGIALFVVIVFVIALLTGLLGIVYYFADRKINESYKSWRGKR